MLEVQRKFFGTLQNTYAFYALYANLDRFDYREALIRVKDRSESDRWIISRLNSLIRTVGEAYESYEPTRATRAIQSFVIDDLSNWYVRLNRKRFWRPSAAPKEGGSDSDKKAAYQTLHTCLAEVARLASPVAPFYMDQLYLDLHPEEGGWNGRSVHLSDFPQSDPALTDTGLEERMKMAQDISSLVHSLRKQHKIKVRQPLARILIPVLDPALRDQLGKVEELILSEVNIKRIEYVDSTSGLIVKKAKPNFRKLGQRFGPRMQELSQAVAGLGQEALARFERDKSLELNLNGDIVRLEEDDLLVQSQDIPGWIVASEGGYTVALDTTITEELLQEGIARDFVNRIQNLRKDMGLDLVDKIHILLADPEPVVRAAIERFREYISTETQALRLELRDDLNGGNELEMDPYVLRVRIETEVLQS